MQFSKRLDRFGDEVFASLNARRTELEAARSSPCPWARRTSSRPRM